MFPAAQAEQIDVDRLSFTGCFQILQCRLPECDNGTSASLTEWFDSLMAEMREEKIEPRRNRGNPRVIKRKMSKWRSRISNASRSPILG
jgi:hypothetical protein